MNTLFADQAIASTENAVADSIWFDSDKQSLIPVDVDPELDDSVNRDSRWLPKPEKVAKPKTPTTPTTNTGNGGLFGTGWTLANVLGWGLLATLFALAIAIILFAMNKAEIDLTANPSTRCGSVANNNTPDEQMIQRMKHLPAELRRTDVNLRTEAERLMNENLFDQAIILLFGHQLLLLDRVGMLRLNRGKTNRKYLRETREINPKTSTALQETVDAFERSYFGRHEITASEFAELWKSNRDLESSIQVDQGAVA
ncbi:DUF4129 domain-containing protein [Rubripirellula reticaptiva]|nr:DUF4129 domain-containing protein [Rubripirellula reticaptiva]